MMQTYTIHIAKVTRAGYTIDHKLLCQTIPQPTTPIIHVMNIIIYNRKGRYSYFYNHILHANIQTYIHNTHVRTQVVSTIVRFPLYMQEAFLFALHFQEHQKNIYTYRYVGNTLYLWALKSYVNM